MSLDDNFHPSNEPASDVPPSADGPVRYDMPAVAGSLVPRMQVESTPQQSASQQSATPQPVPASAPTPPTRQVPSFRFQTELQTIVATSATSVLLRSRLINCLIKHRSLVGGVCYRQNDEQLTALATVLDHPALQHKNLRAWIEEMGRSAIASGADVIARSTIVRNLVLTALPYPTPDGGREAMILLSTSAQPAATDDADRSAVKMDADVLAGHAAVWAITQWHSGDELEAANGDLRVTAALLELKSQMEEADSRNEASQIVVNHVQEFLQAESVALGLCPPGRVTCQLTAISGTARFDPQSELARQIAAAIDEAINRGSVSTFPAQEESDSHETVALRILAEALQCTSVTTVPVSAAEHVIGALCVVDAPVSGDDARDSEAMRFLRVLDEPLGTALSAVQRRQPGIIGRAMRRVFGPGRSALTIIATVLLVATVVLMIPFPYRIACQFQCEPVTRNFSVAPYDGLLETTLVEPGDMVRKGQSLARMDGREVQLELSELAAERHRAGKERDVYLADEQVAESFMSALEADRITHRRNLLLGRIEQLEIRSQADGIVLSGSMDRRENYPVKTGEMLYEIAPLSPLRMEVAVPDDEVIHVQEGMEVEFRVDSDPSTVLTGTVKRIRPRSESIEQDNVFVAEVEIENKDGQLRPGMKGSARIISDRHPLGWNLFHRASEHVVARILW